MKFKDKLWNLPIGIVLGGYVVFCSINAIVHVAGFYTACIKESKESNLYNYIDTDGNLESAWFEEQ